MPNDGGPYGQQPRCRHCAGSNLGEHLHERINLALWHGSRRRRIHRLFDVLGSHVHVFEGTFKAVHDLRYRLGAAEKDRAAKAHSRSPKDRACTCKGRTFEIASTFMEPSTLSIPLTTLPIDRVTCCILMADSRREATASTLEERRR